MFLCLCEQNCLSLSLSSPKRFIGYDSESGELKADTLRHCIYGGHVSDYMKQLQDEDEEKYKAHFSRFIKEGVSADNASGHVTWSCDFCDDVTLYIQMEEMYKNAHAAIRADPVFHKKPAREGFVPKRYVHSHPFLTKFSKKLNFL